MGNKDIISTDIPRQITVDFPNLLLGPDIDPDHFELLKAANLSYFTSNFADRPPIAPWERRRLAGPSTTGSAPLDGPKTYAAIVTGCERKWRSALGTRIPR